MGKGILERREQFYTDNYGEIRRSFTIDDRDIRVEGPSFMSIEDFRPRDGSETLIYVKNGGWIDELFLEIDGTGMIAPFHNLEGETIFRDIEDDDFMRVVVEELHRFGSVRINVRAKNYDRHNRIPVEIGLFTRLDVEVRR